jgi:hypothetical protein
MVSGRWLVEADFLTTDNRPLIFILRMLAELRRRAFQHLRR